MILTSLALLFSFSAIAETVERSEPVLLMHQKTNSYDIAFYESVRCTGKFTRIYLDKKKRLYDLEKEFTLTWEHKKVDSNWVVTSTVKSKYPNGSETDLNRVRALWKGIAEMAEPALAYFRPVELLKSHGVSQLSKKSGEGFVFFHKGPLKRAVASVPQSNNLIVTVRELPDKAGYEYGELVESETKRSDSVYTVSNKKGFLRRIVTHLRRVEANNRGAGAVEESIQFRNWQQKPRAVAYPAALVYDRKTKTNRVTLEVALNCKGEKSAGMEAPVDIDGAYEELPMND